MKVFISMGSTEQVKMEMCKVRMFIREQLEEAEFIDSVIDGANKDIALKGDGIAMWYLAKSFELMAGADLVFFVNNWQDFRGCVNERNVAEAYGKFCIDIEVKEL